VAEERPDDRPEREMLEAFRKAMASRSAREAALTATRLGDVYLESDSYSDALGYYAQAADEELGSTLTDAELGRLYARIARCHLGLGDCKEARAYCDDANELELDEEDRSVAAEIDVVRARVEIESGRFEEALSAAQRAYDVLKTCPDSPQLAGAGKALGIANATGRTDMIGQINEAIRQARKLMERRAP